jgi:hypothetical protein
VQLFGQGCQAVACCRAALCLRAAFHVYTRCFFQHHYRLTARAAHGVSQRGPALCVWRLTQGAGRVYAVGESRAARTSPPSSPARPQSQVDRGPADAHSLSDGLRRARDVHAAPVSVLTGHVSHMRANGPYGSPLCVLRVSSGIQVPISFSLHELPPTGTF